MLGLIAYATDELTNLATLENRPLAMALVDTAWGTVPTAAPAAIVVAVLRAPE